MNVFESRYYSKTKLLLEIVGLWPYQSKTRRWIGLFTFYVITLSGEIPMVLFIILNKLNLQLLAENLINVAFVFVSQLKYTIVFSTASQMKLLLSQIKKDWKQIKDQEELKILKNHAEKSRLISLFYMIFVYSACLGFVGPAFLTQFLEIYFPLKNGSYPQLPPVWAEYLLFQQFDYYFLTCLHQFFSIAYIQTMFGGTDAIYLCTVQHASALFSIVCYRCKNIFNSENDKVNLKRLEEAVELYNKAVRCCHLLEDSFSTCIFIILTLCTVGLGGTSRLFVDVDGLYIKLKCFTIIFGITSQVFYLNWVGQRVIDTSEKVFSSVYFSNWYLMPPKIRKSIIIIMNRTLKPQQLTAGKMITLSMYNFGKIMRTCTSVFAAFSWLAAKHAANQ